MWRYLDTLGYQFDCFLNALAGGEEDQTISMRAALAKRAGSRVGCALCRWLSWTVERRHCTKQLDGDPVVRWAAVEAGVQLFVVGLVLWLLSFWIATL